MLNRGALILLLRNGTAEAAEAMCPSLCQHVEIAPFRFGARGPVLFQIEFRFVGIGL